MLRIYAIALASLAAVTMAAGAGGVRAGSMTAPSTGTVSGDWDIDTDVPGTATHQAESVGADFSTSTGSPGQMGGASRG
jgi:hypothetical protein